MPSLRSCFGRPRRPRGLYLGRGEDVETGKRRDVVLTDADLLRSVYAVGSTRSGKTTALLNLLLQAVEQGIPFAVFDLEGSIYRALLATAASETPGWPVAFVSPTSDTSYSLPLNPLVGEPYRASQELLTGFRYAFPDGFTYLAARMEDLLRSGALLLARHGLSLHEFDDLLLDPRLGETLALSCPIAPVRRFWTEYRAQLSKARFREWAESTRNKISSLTTSPYLGPMLACDSCFDARAFMDNGISLVVHLDEEQLQDGMKLAASLILGRFAIAAASRAEGAPTYLLVVDEAQEFDLAVLNRLISRRQKRGIGLIVAHQHRAQMDWQTVSALIGNCGTRIGFRLGDFADAKYLAEQLLDLKGDRVKTQHTEKLWGGLIKIPTDVRFWSIQEELHNFASVLHGQGRGEAVLSQEDGTAYWLSTPPPQSVDTPTDEDISAYLSENHARYLTHHVDVEDATSRRRAYLDHLEVDRRKSEAAALPRSVPRGTIRRRS